MNNGATKSQQKLPEILDLAAAEVSSKRMRERCGWRELSLQQSLDASGVETLTVPCIQILLAAQRIAMGYRSRSIGRVLAAFEDLGSI